MRPRHTAIAALLLTATLTTGCGSSDDTADKPKPDKTPTSKPAAPGGIPPEPTGVEREAYLAALKAIDPKLVADEDKAIDAGRNQCSSLDGGAKDPDNTAAQRFSMGGNTVDEVEAKAINTALRATLCPE